MPDPSIGPRYAHSNSAVKKRTVDTSSLSGIEAASKGPTTEQKLIAQPTKVSEVIEKTPVIRNSNSNGEYQNPADTQVPQNASGVVAGNIVAGGVIAAATARETQITGHPGNIGTTAAQITSSGNPTPQNQRFLEINDVNSNSTAVVTASPIESAAVNVQDSIETRDSLPVSIQHYYQPQVTLARENLVEVVQDEIETREYPARSPHGDLLPIRVQRSQTSQDIVGQFTDEPVLGAHVIRAVEAANVNIEVDDTVNLVNRASSSDRALNALDNVYEDLSPVAQGRVLADENVQEVFADVANEVTTPLRNPSTNHRIMDEVRISADALDEVVQEVDNPDLAAEVVRHTAPAFDRAIEINAERDDLNAGGVNFDGLVTENTLDILGSVSDRIAGGRKESEALDVLTRLALEGTTSVTAPLNAGVPDTSEGKGITLALSIVDAHKADPSSESQEKATIAVEHLIADFDRYANDSEGPVATAVNEFSEHTEELNYYISFASEETSPELLHAAIEQYTDNKNAEWLDENGITWEARLGEIEGNVADHGATLLRNRELLSEYTELTPSGENALSEAADTDNFAVAASIALDSDEHIDVLNEIDADSALDFFATLKNTNRATGLSTKLANWQLSNVVAGSIADVVSGDPESIANARTAIDSLRTERFATALGIDGQLDELNLALDALEETLPDGTPIPADQIAERFAEFESKIDRISIFSNESNLLGAAIRSLGLAASAQGAYSATTAFFNDPSIESGIDAALADIGFYRTATDFAKQLGYEPRDSALGHLGSNKTVGKVLGGAAVLWGTYGVAKDLYDGEFTQAALGTAGVTGAALPLIFSSSSWAGPVGAAISVGVVLGSYQVNRVNASNEYTGEAARDFLGELGFDNDAARALADRSGETYQAVDALIKYGNLNGLDYQESIDWINSLDKDQLDYVRDRFHHMLDRNDGSLNDFNQTSENDAATIRRFENPRLRHYVPISAATADWILESRGIPRPQA